MPERNIDSAGWRRHSDPVRPPPRRPARKGRPQSGDWVHGPVEVTRSSYRTATVRRF